MRRAAAMCSGATCGRLYAEHPVQVDRKAGPAGIQQICDRAQQVPQQITGSLDCGDNEMHLVEIDDETEQVEMQRTERQVEDGAGCLSRSIDSRTVDRPISGSALQRQRDEASG